MPSANKLFKSLFCLWRKHDVNLFFQQDSVPVHRARDTIELLQCTTPDFVAPDMWPPNSPDLNPVDYAISSVIQQRCMRPEFMTSMSYDSIYCICALCGAVWSSRWSMMQLTNAQHACMVVFVPEADILDTLCDYQFVFSVLDELYVSHHVWCSRWCSKSAL